MVWPHQPDFPHRVAIVMLGCVAAAAVGALWPGLPFGQRPIMVVAAFYSVFSGFFTYGLLLMLLRFIPRLHAVVAYFLFYAAITMLGLPLLQLFTILFGRAISPPVPAAVNFTVGVTGALGVAAAAFGAINRPKASPTFRWSGP